MMADIMLYVLMISISSIFGGIIGSFVALSIINGPRELWGILKAWWAGKV